MAAPSPLALAALAVPGLDVPAGAGAIEISDVTADSRKVSAGALFAA
jgi:hypothetical protein